MTILQFWTFEQTDELLIATPNRAPHDINRNQANNLQTVSYVMKTKSGTRASEFFCQTLPINCVLLSKSA